MRKEQESQNDPEEAVRGQGCGGWPIILKKHVDEKERQGKYTYPKEIHEGSKSFYSGR